MDNEITNELSNCRAERLYAYTPAQIAQAVQVQLKERGGDGAMLSTNVDEHTIDWVRPMWDEAVRSADTMGLLVYGEAGRYVTRLDNLAPVQFHEVVAYVASRVALALLIIVGLKG